MEFFDVLDELGKFIDYYEFKQAVINKDKDFVIHEESYSMLLECLNNYINK